MSRARIFKSGSGQAVQLPKGFRFRVNEVEIFRRGEEIVLRKPSRGLGRVIDVLADMPEDFMTGSRGDGPPQKRNFSF